MNNEDISGIWEAPRRIKFTFCNLLRNVRNEKKKYQDFLFKNANQIWRELSFRTLVCLFRKILPWMKTKSQQR